MNALNESARIVDKAWCQGSLKAEDEAREAGDTYCAVGAMAHAFSLVNGLIIDWRNRTVGDETSLTAWDEAMKEYRGAMREWQRAREAWVAANPDKSYADYFDVESLPAGPDREEFGVTGIEAFIGSTEEGKILAQTILANFSDRTSYTKEFLDEAIANDFGNLDDIVSDLIISFNDHSDTNREDVAAMMEKAAVSFDDAVAFEDKTTDDLVEEINELIDA